ncbi:MAG: DNA polymerase I [Polyangiales bacterium]
MTPRPLHPALPKPGAEDVLYVLDLSGYVFRAYHALPPLSNAAGEATHAVHGVANMLLKLLDQQTPRHFAVALDSRGPGFRDALYPDYKANRPPAPPDLQQQMERITALVTALGLPMLHAAGAEADDVIATTVHWARQQGLSVVMVSADKDLLQLVDDAVWMYDSMRDRLFDCAATEAKFGVAPAQVADCLALMGDSSDNVPGVPAIGAKSAAALLQQFGSLEAIYADLDAVPRPRWRQTLAQHEAQARLSKALVTLRYDLPLSLSRAALTPSAPDANKLLPLLRELELGRLLRRFSVALGEGGAVAAPADAPSPVTVTCQPQPTFAAWQKAVADLPAGSVSLVAQPSAAAPQVVVAYVAEHPAVLWQSDGDAPATVESQAWLTALVQSRATRFSALEARRTVVVADLKPWLGRALLLASTDEVVAAAVFDLGLASYLLEAGGRHDAAALPARWLSEAAPAELQEGAALSNAAQAAVQAAVQQLQLHTVLSARLNASSLQALFDRVEMPLRTVLAQLQAEGITVHAPYLHSLAQEVAGQIDALERQCHTLAGHAFNLNSPKQLEGVLFDELGLPVVRRTKTGRSTDHAVLEALAPGAEIAALLLEHRRLAKLKNAYLDALPRQIDAQTGRIHTCFHQKVTATGRISSSDPNLQNIPIRGELGRAIRQAFVPRPGWRLLAADYSQIELRVLAHLSEDSALLEAMGAGEDVHVRTACALFDAAPEVVTPKQRAQAKTVNFAVIYGQTRYTLGRSLGIDGGAAQRYIDAFFARYAGVRRYFDMLLQEARATGEVRTLLGRRRSVAELNSRNHNRRSAAERIACNTPIQGSAADILKLAMLAAERSIRQAKLEARMLLTVHDELVFEAPPSEQDRLATLVEQAMQQAYTLQVPLIVQLGWGQNWAEAH